MSNTNHTPGPWEINDTLNLLEEDYDGQDIIISKEACPIATVRGTNDMSCIDDEDEYKITEEVLANANLIAVAPELLEASKELLIAIEQYDFFKDGYSKGSASISEVSAAGNNQEAAYTKLWKLIKDKNL